MTVTLAYDAGLSRVRIDADGLSAAVTADVERSTDQITWTVVRGGSAVPVTAGALATVDDYEFSPSVLNYYRVRYAATATFVAAGTAAHADNATVVPGLPAGATTGDLLLVWCATRQSAQATPTPPPTDYVELLNAGNARLFGKIHDGSESAPTVNLTGAGAVGMSVSAQMAALRGVSIEGFTEDAQLNASAQNIAWPALSVGADNQAVLTLGWKQDDWTSVTGPGTEIGEPSTTLGDDQGVVWAYTIQTAAADIIAGSFTVTGGTSVVSRGAVVALAPNTLSQQNSITPTMDEIWIKNLSRPFLNLPATVVDWSDVAVGSRSATFPIKGRSYPIAVSDLMLGRSFTLTLRALTVDEAEDIRLSLASGDPILLHTPPGCMVPGPMYAALGNPRIRRPSNRRAEVRYLEIPLEEVAAPTADVVGTTNTWAAVIATYVTWNDLIAANATWQDVLDGIADPGDVIVP